MVRSLSTRFPILTQALDFQVLMIQEVDALDPILYPLLRKDLSHQGMGLAVTIGDKRVDYNEGFCLYLTTRNPSLNLPPDARALLCVTNFTVTHSGLESQLLAATIQHEQPELELQRRCVNQCFCFNIKSNVFLDTLISKRFFLDDENE